MDDKHETPRILHRDQNYEHIKKEDWEAVKSKLQDLEKQQKEMKGKEKDGSV